MNTIEPNTWYTLYRVFGDNLFDLDSNWIKEHDPKKTLERMLSHDLPIAKFKGSDFTMQLDLATFSLGELSTTPGGKRIYYPVDTVSWEDMEEIYHGTTEQFRTRKFAEVVFGVIDILEEDTTGGQYRYKLVLRSDNKSFVSEAEVAFEEDNTPYGWFYDWNPEQSGETGSLYLPLSYQKVVPVEIMLRER